MKKQAKAKAKTAKRSTKQVAATNEMPDLVTVMLKVAERLEALESKMERVLTQTAGRAPETRHAPQPVQHAAPQHDQHSQPSHHQGQRSHSQQPGGHSNHPLNQNKQPQQNHGRHERTLYQAVCADCRKHCEVPFKPTGERPVFCKACFALRKSNGNGMKGNNQQPGAPIQQPTRQVRVFPNGGGKVTITDVAVAPKRKPAAKPAKKSKR